MRQLLALALPLALAATAPAPASAKTDEAPARNCFHSSDWRGWNVSENGDALYLRVRLNEVYRVGLTPGSHVRRSADHFLINEITGSSWICDPIDLRLTLADHQGFSEPLFPLELRKLTAEEAAAIPAHNRPN